MLRVYVLCSTIAVLAIGVGAPAAAALPAAKAAAKRSVDDLPADVAQQIVALESEKATRTAAEQKMDSQLLQAFRESQGKPMAAGVNLQPANVYADDTGNLFVDVSARTGAQLDTLVTEIEGLGGKVVYPSWQYKTLRARINISMAEAIAGLPEVKFIGPAIGSLHSQAAQESGVARHGERVRPTFAERADRVAAELKATLHSAGIRRLLTGSVDSEGDRAHRADDTRNTFGYLGGGLRIGVLSDSFNATGGAAADVASGDLPGPGNPFGHTTPVTVVQDFGTGADEGRAMLQIVHDVAPLAQLFFATADVSEAGFASNIQALRNAPNNCDIIIDDVFYFDEPVFQDGIVAQAVNTVTASGALYFSSAGNEGNVVDGTAGYFEGDFNDAGSPAFTFPGGAKSGTIHNFGTVASPLNGDILTARGLVYNLNWSDPSGASANDYDLFLVSSTGVVKASSTNIQNGTQNPYEAIAPPSLAAGDRLVVFKTNASAVRAFALNTLRGGLTVVTTGQTHGHSAAVNAFSVAATPAADAFGPGSPTGPFPGSFVASDKSELFTSDGPRRVFFNANGTAITPGNVLFGTNGGAVRNKPDITAADGVSTTLPSGSGLNPFYGTSAAAPHAGAIAALLRSANPALTPAQIRTILTTTALDIEAAGYDVDTGFGIVQAFQAMQAVSPAPQGNVVLGTVTPSEAAFSNGNGNIDPGETGQLVVQLTNPGMAVATSVSATLSTSAAGVTIGQGTVSYGTIAAGGSASNSGSPFTFFVGSSVPCGTVIPFTLTVTFAGGPSPQIFKLTVTVGRGTGTISSTLGTTPPTG
ncbi:MAG TPA: S8 family serine peptidase, partial [Thermoanaerobaculia bacterium]|nr:S8 family serine peptidase [Thermoanaerobaculia bacterium]